MRETQKQRERRYLDRFAASYADFPGGEIAHSERPDFLVAATGGPLGIEISEVFRPGPPHGGSLQAQESLQERCLQLAAEIHQRRGGPSLDVAAHFSGGSPLSKSRVEGLAYALAEAVGESRPLPGEVIALNREDELPGEVDRLRIFRFHELTRPFWHAAGAIDVPTLNPPVIQSLIDRKAALLSEYRKQCAECWLILVADGFSLAGSVDLSEEVRNHPFSSPFGRAFFFQMFERHILHLFTTRGPSAGAQ